MLLSTTLVGHECVMGPYFCMQGVACQKHLLFRRLKVPLSALRMLPSATLIGHEQEKLHGHCMQHVEAQLLLLIPLTHLMCIPTGFHMQPSNMVFGANASVQLVFRRAARKAVKAAAVIWCQAWKQHACSGEPHLASFP